MKEYNREIELDFLEFFAKRYKNGDIVQVEFKNGSWKLLRINRNGTQSGGHHIQEVSFQFQTKNCQVVQNTADYENAIQSSTKEKELLWMVTIVMFSSLKNWENI